MEKENIRKIKFRNTLKVEFEVMQISNVFKRFQEGDIEFDIGKFHRPQFNMILLVENDGAKHFVDFKMYNLNRNDILMVGENRVHAFSTDQKLEGTAILFTSNFIEVNEAGMNYLKKLFDTYIISKQGGDSTIRGLFDILKGEYKHNSRDSTALYRYLLGSLLTKLDMLIDEDKTAKNDNEHMKVMLNLDRSIEKFRYQCRDSRRYAREMGYSYKQLNIICKSISGDTLKSYIDDAVILEMKRQIVANDMSLKELCIFFDFDEETNLVKYFKRCEGISPKKFKDRYKNFQE